MTNKKHLSLLLLLVSLVTFSQKKKEPTIHEKVWNNKNVTAYQNTETPSNWLNESAVYLFRTENYIYDRPHNSIEYTKISHSKIKLLDQAAVKEFSTFKYPSDDSRGFNRVTYTLTVGVKVIKPDGTEIVIDTEEEVIEDEKGRKLAISNLEKGDVIEYFFHKNYIMSENDLYHYAPVENYVNTEYPIVNYRFSLTTEKDFFLNYSSLNGVPELKRENIKTKSKKDNRREYSFELKNVAKNNSKRWFYPYIELPAYKFQVNFARTGKYEKKAYTFISSDANVIKNSVKKEDIFNFYEDQFKPSGKLNDVQRFLKDKNFSSDEEKVKAVYYYIRHIYFTNYIEAIVVNDANIIYPYGYYDKSPIFFNEEKEFIKFFAAFLKNEKIDYEILVGTKRYNGDIKNLLLESNVNFLMKVNTSPSLYIESFNHISNVNRINNLLEDTNAYALKVTDRKHIEDIETISFPKSDYTENNNTEKLNIVIPDDFSTATVQRTSIYNGHNKVDKQKDILKFYDYVYEDYKKYGTKTLYDKIKNKKEKTKYKKEFNALIAKLKEKQETDFLSKINNEYSFDLDNYSFEILKTGRYDALTPLEVTEEFNITSDLIKRAGKNYVLEVGKLIGGQVEIDEKEKERNHNIYMGYSRSFNNEIAITIPKGYTVTGLNNLTKKVENSTGGFTSSAVIEDGVLKINTQKYYTNNFEPKENWPKMISFLDAAYQFTQEKILLKKS
ncbi:MAG: hypothetical protein ACPG45_10180 [Flavobacteriaceae bacterium]